MSGFLLRCAVHILYHIYEKKTSHKWGAAPKALRRTPVICQSRMFQEKSFVKRETGGMTSNIDYPVALLPEQQKNETDPVCSCPPGTFSDLTRHGYWMARTQEQIWAGQGKEQGMDFESWVVSFTHTHTYLPHAQIYLGAYPGKGFYGNYWDGTGVVPSG